MLVNQLEYQSAEIIFDGDECAIARELNVMPWTRIQFVSATLVFGLAAFDCSLAISSSHTSLGVL